MFSENIGTDQLCRNCKAYLRLFFVYWKSHFSCALAQISWCINFKLSGNRYVSREKIVKTYIRRLLNIWMPVLTDMGLYCFFSIFTIGAAT